ncbi:Uncharacterized protein DAT39_004881, partial [Clarias magur]
MTWLLDRKSAGDYEETPGSDLLLQLFGSSPTDPAKEAPEMSRHISQPPQR